MYVQFRLVFLANGMLRLIVVNSTIVGSIFVGNN